MSVIRSMTTITRDQQEVEVVYVDPSGCAFWTPDGEGRYWFDSLGEALDAHPDGLLAQVVHLDAAPEA